MEGVGSICVVVRSFPVAIVVLVGRGHTGGFVTLGKDGNQLIGALGAMCHIDRYKCGVLAAGVG